MECSGEDMCTAAGYDFDWRLVGSRLLSDQAIRAIDKGSGSEGEKRKEMLLEWKRSRARDGTYSALVKVLRDLENNTTAEQVEELERKAATQGDHNTVCRSVQKCAEMCRYVCTI